METHIRGAKKNADAKLALVKYNLPGWQQYQDQKKRLQNGSWGTLFPGRYKEGTYVLTPTVVSLIKGAAFFEDKETLHQIHRITLPDDHGSSILHMFPLLEIIRDDLWFLLNFVIERGCRTWNVEDVSRIIIVHDAVLCLACLDWHGLMTHQEPTFYGEVLAVCCCEQSVEPTRCLSYTLFHRWSTSARDIHLFRQKYDEELQLISIDEMLMDAPPAAAVRCERRQRQFWGELMAEVYRPPVSKVLGLTAFDEACADRALSRWAEHGVGA